ncbi:hypothetical protein [Paraburkholderia fungorum]|uniref:hypothetical protein n=1 Tax=Paraburkholderia fungorum TaxID=134537 RepID=UPI00138DDA70|nr:hypothetical protein [Paraburkholderia fungorum]MBB5542760.1 hypothetical protein [Paraburkholderia fungorum]MBU7437651.1 hypothetical protein [Paraburkholderia fungorum]
MMCNQDTARVPRLAAQWLDQQSRDGSRKDTKTPGKPTHGFIDALVSNAILMYADTRREVAFATHNLQRYSSRRPPVLRLRPRHGGLSQIAETARASMESSMKYMAAQLQLSEFKR